MRQHKCHEAASTSSSMLLQMRAAQVRAHRVQPGSLPSGNAPVKVREVDALHGLHCGPRVCPVPVMIVDMKVTEETSLVPRNQTPYASTASGYQLYCSRLFPVLSSSLVNNPL